MKGKLFLSGGGKEEDLFKLKFFKDLNKILYIPIAWPNDDFNSCLIWFKEISSSNKNLIIDMYTDTNQPIELSNYDAIFIGGGNTFKLLKRLRESNLDKKLIKFLENGGKVYGGSAGAIIWGNNIETAKLCVDKDKNLVGLKDTSGFNKTQNHDIQCHFEDYQINEHQSYIKRTDRNVIAIPDGAYLLIEDGKYIAKGDKPITIITQTGAIKFSPGSYIKL